MLRPRVALLVAPIFLAGPVQAQLSIWNGPGADWNNAANWSAGVPDPGETALFNGATPKAVAVAGAGVDIATIQFDPHAPPGYTFAINSTSFALTGAGVVNNSAQAPTFNISAFAFLDFYGAASAGNAIIGSNSSFISFNDSANAANAQITLANSLLSFASDGTTAGSAAITNNSGGTTQFLGASTAGGATIANNAGGTTSFSNSSNAGSATINNNAASSNLRFSDTSRAGTANITNRGTVSFGALGNGDTASADRATIINDGLSAVTRFFGFTRGGNATITANNGSQVLFFENSTGENARFIVDATSRVDFSGTRGLLNDGRVSAGSIEGAGTVILPDGTLTIGSNNLSTDFSGTLTQCGCNPGRLEKIGIGTLTLSEINGYSGGTTIAAGTLVMAHATAGAIDAVGTGNVTLNGGALRSTVTGTLANDVTFGSGTTSTLAAANGTTLTLIGTGTFSDSVARFGSVSDAGTIIASFAGTGSSNTTAIEVNGGILRAGSSGFTSVTGAAASTTVASGATLDFNDQSLTVASSGVRNLLGAGNVIIGSNAARTLRVRGGEFSGVISGAGRLARATFGAAGASDTLILTGVNTYAGGTTITGGILQLGTGGATGSILGDVTNNGTFAVNRSNTYSFAGLISGSGAFEQNGGGTTILTANNTYTGATTINNGVLVVNGSLASTVDVNGGALMGTGAVGGLNVNNGSLAPGNSIGTITINGSLVMSAAASYIVEVSPTDADRTNVVGTASLAGTLTLIPTGGVYQIGRQYLLLNATGGRTGTFTTGDLTGLFGAAIIPRVGYDASNVYLTLDPGAISPFLPANASQNARNVARAIDQIFVAQASNSPPAFFSLFNLTPAGLQNALNQLSGEAASGMKQSSFLSTGLFLNAMIDPFVSGRNGGFGAAMGYAPEAAPHPAEQAFAMVTKAPPRAETFENRWNMWGSAYGGRNRTDGDPIVVGSHDLSASTGGFAGGADYRVAPGTVLGAAVAIGETHWNVSGLGKGDANAAKIGGYASTRWNSLYMSAAVAGAWYRAETERTVTIAGADRLESDFDARSFGARAEAGWRFALAGFGAMPNLGVTPYAAVQAQSLRTPSHSERASFGSNQFALTYARQTTTGTRSELGGWLDNRHTLDSGASLLLRARVAWVHDFDPDRRFRAAFQTLPGASFTVDGAAAPRNAALTSAVAEIRLRNAVTLSGKFDGEFARRSQTYAGTGTLRYAW